MSPCTEDTVTGNLPAHDLAAAKSALDAAGWTAGAGGVRAKNGAKLSLAFYYPTSLGPTLQSGAELLQKAWSELGVEVSLKAVSTAEIGTVILAAQGTWHAVLLPLTVTLPSQLVPFLSGPVAPNGNNFAGIKNPAYDAAVKKASSIAGTDGCPDWAAAEKALISSLDVVPFVDSTVPAFGQGVTFELNQGASPRPPSGCSARRPWRSQLCRSARPARSRPGTPIRGFGSRYGVGSGWSSRCWRW